MTKSAKRGKRIIICPRCSHWVGLDGKTHARIAPHNCIGCDMTEMQYRVWRQLPVRMEFS